ncbi:unnamed protein product [Timema podura]|uniref:Uncharacterized protein n=1 Tax=Timema podura TaxID=61482 RepID=A0ABN7NLG2_TIMPD|nr:unnamed protein product [Timema podura]
MYVQRRGASYSLMKLVAAGRTLVVTQRSRSNPGKRLYRVIVTVIVWSWVCACGCARSAANVVPGYRHWEVRCGTALEERSDLQTKCLNKCLTLDCPEETFPVKGIPNLVTCYLTLYIKDSVPTMTKVWSNAVVVILALTLMVTMISTDIVQSNCISDQDCPSGQVCMATSDYQCSVKNPCPRLRCTKVITLSTIFNR